MLVFEIVIGLLLVGTVLAAIARRIATPYPALLALAGAAFAFLPGVPTLVLDPELALTLFVAPVLLDAAFDTSVRDLRSNWRAVTSLAIGAVILTVLAVAVVARALVPAMPWAVAIALGAVVAPPDAAAATAVLRQLRPPYRLMVILEGESLFNDASALLIYRLAVGAAVAGTLSAWSVVPTLLVVTVGSVVLGFVLSRIVVYTTKQIDDVATSVIFQICFTFAIWILAEGLHLSGILTTVVFAMSASRFSAGSMPARIRIPSYAVWEVGVFVLNVLAFILVGFQLRSIITRIDQATLIQYLGFAATVGVATILARMAWVNGAVAFARWRERRNFGNQPGAGAVLSSQSALVVGWCGMRGIVTLAAALALPTGSEEGAAFPYRDLILFTAFAVVLITLVIQGMTLRPLITRLDVHDDGSVEHEVRLGRVETLRAALSTVSAASGAETADLVRRRYDLQLRRAEAAFANNGAGNNEPGQNDGGPRPTPTDAEIVRAALSAERQRLLALRADGTIGDAAFQRLEQDLDLEELYFEQLLGTQPTA